MFIVRAVDWQKAPKYVFRDPKIKKKSWEAHSLLPIITHSHPILSFLSASILRPKPTDVLVAYPCSRQSLSEVQSEIVAYIIIIIIIIFVNWLFNGVETGDS